MVTPQTGMACELRPSPGMDSRIREVLIHKPGKVHSVQPQVSVRDAVHMMNEHRIGSLLVLVHETPKGMFTERDVLRRVVEPARDPETTRVQDVMSTELVTVSPDDLVGAVMRRMTETRHRHMPVMDGSELYGLVSIGDLTAWVTRHLRFEVHDLTTYINGPAVEAS